MSQTYKITLKPIGAFYFGGEESFSSAPLDGVANMKYESTKKYFQKRQGYFAKSEMFPQQTQLLGMLRKELLRSNEKLYYFKNFVRVPKHLNDDATKIVGSGRWATTGRLDLGSIEGLTALGIEKEDKRYISAPFDRGLSLETTGVGYINSRKPSQAYAFKKCDGNYFGAKDYLCDDLIAKDKSILKIDDIFKSFTQTQTQTLGYKEDNDEQLFKVQKYRLDERCQFVFYLTLSDSAYLGEYKSTIELGGERSRFVMQVIKEDKPDMQNDFSYLKTAQSRIVLTSDAYVDAKIFECCKVTLSKKRILRTLQRPFNKSKKTVLLARGTVFYPHQGKEQEVKERIEASKNFTTIGYNQYLDLTQGEKNED